MIGKLRIHIHQRLSELFRSTRSTNKSVVNGKIGAQPELGPSHLPLVISSAILSNNLMFRPSRHCEPLTTSPDSHIHWTGLDQSGCYQSANTNLVL